MLNSVLGGHLMAQQFLSQRLMDDESDPTAKKNTSRTAPKKKIAYIRLLDAVVTQADLASAQTLLARDYLTLTLSNAHVMMASTVERLDMTSSQTRRTFFSLLADWLSLAEVDEPTKNKLYNLALVLIDEHETRQSGVHVACAATDHVTIPGELKMITTAAITVETYIIDQAIYLLSKTHRDFFSTPTLLYQSNSDPFHDQPNHYLKAQANTFSELARANLSRLQPGQKLMIPLHCIDINPSGLSPSSSHISPVVALRIDQGFKFYLFDSWESAERNEYKENLINSLIVNNMYREFFYHGMAFQWENDCAIHTYNFFRLCTLSAEYLFSTADGTHLLFRQYVDNLEKLKEKVNHDTLAASSLLRIFFTLDCIKTGYQDQYHDIGGLLQIYDPQNESPPEEAAASANCFNDLWDSLRHHSCLGYRHGERRRIIQTD
ncbi:hypothetical protein SJI19_07565 [Acerihabitans sp. TG2]|uniref:hypothetical protein n=1 Tax=Acerihabitans sp. TG2 TaxID=3096008 RepID=UPI002B2370A3|nr:hypothetical protein [Acerihabitans sp. TG2]MEA9390400.1 hypothetical protein [Acerihabitans sp. TG2]